MTLNTNNKEKNYKKNFFKLIKLVYQSNNQLLPKIKQLKIKTLLSINLKSCKIFKRKRMISMFRTAKHRMEKTN